jgi:hypothetical protein
MKKLPDYAKSLLIHGSGITGNFTEGYYFVEEELRIKDAKDLFDFCQWVDQHIGGASLHNIDMLFSAYIDPTNQELQNGARALSDRIKRLRSY